ncbi:hypothetical protein [Streptomyces sp. CBG31]|uniref:hypothetical protein n=1 Tax=Streptomyces sp. CBG31 TaxID=2762623 RepID=UPI001EFD8F24|nr:hypothetical protein [Streptomyces sp. CBG31]
MTMKASVRASVSGRATVKLVASVVVSLPSAQGAVGEESRMTSAISRDRPRAAATAPVSSPSSSWGGEARRVVVRAARIRETTASAMPRARLPKKIRAAHTNAHTARKRAGRPISMMTRAWRDSATARTGPSSSSARPKESAQPMSQQLNAIIHLVTVKRNSVPRLSRPRSQRVNPPVSPFTR